MSKKIITVLLDGLGDRCFEELNGQSPLEYAKTPNLDALCQQSQCGLMTPYKPGIALGTDMAHYILFGGDVLSYPSRSVTDFIGEGHNVDKSALYLRTSFATVCPNEEGFLLEERFTPVKDQEEALSFGEVMTFSFEGHDFKWWPSYDSHGFLSVKGPFISSAISDVDPFYKPQYVMACEAFETTDTKSIQMAECLNRYLKEVHRRLSSHPLNDVRKAEGLQAINFLLTKWAGQPEALESFEEMNGLKGVLVGKSKLLKGLTSQIAMTYVEEEDFGKGLEFCLKDRKYDYYHLHTKAPDTAAHTKNPMEKARVLEELDSHLEALIGLQDTLVVVTGDHSTPSGTSMIHSGDDVPILFAGQGLRSDDLKVFSERQCAKGSIRMNGQDFMPVILNFANRSKLYHLRAGKKRRCFTPLKVNKL